MGKMLARAIDGIGAALAFLRGPKRPTVLGAFALLFYVLAGFSLNVTVGFAVAGLYFTLMDWRFSGVDEDGGRG